MINKLKNIFTSNSLEYPKLTIIISLLLTAIILTGSKYLVQDDDMVKLLPDDIQSIITFGYKSFCDYSIQNIKVISNFLSEVEKFFILLTLLSQLFFIKEKILWHKFP